MKYLPIAQLIVLILILISLNGSLIASGVSTVTKMFESKPTATKAEVPRRRKSA